MLPRPPSRLDSMQEVQLYLINLHRDLERALKELNTPMNNTDYQLGNVTISRDVDSVATVAELKDVVKTLVTDLNNYGIINSQGTII